MTYIPTKELEADLLRAKIALETERNIQHLTLCDVWVNAGEKLIVYLESIIADRKERETHVEKMVELLKRAYQLVTAESRFPGNNAAGELERDMRLLLAKLEAKTECKCEYPTGIIIGYGEQWKCPRCHVLWVFFDGDEGEGWWKKLEGQK